MRKIAKVLVPLLTVLLLATGLSVSVSADFALQESVNLSGDGVSVAVSFTPDQEGTYRLFCHADTEENEDKVFLTVNGQTVIGGQVAEKELTAGETYVLSLTAEIPMTVTVFIERVESTETDPSESGSSTESTTSTGEVTTTIPSESTTTGIGEDTTTIPSETTTTTTTVPTTTTTSVPTSSTGYPTRTVTRTVPTVSYTSPTTYVTRFTYPTRTTVATLAPDLIENVRPTRPIRPTGSSDDGDDEQVPVGKWVLFPMIALLILVGGGVAIYFIFRSNQPKHH